MAKIEKNKLIEKVKELEDLSNDEKSALIGYIKTKTYGLVWEDSTEKAWVQLKDYIPVLTEDKSKAIVNDTDEQKNPNHILIEGDNLLALTNLCFTHEGKVDVIYIDPPYNTGNKKDGAFIYNDKIVDSEDTYIHSKWLSFMKKRLTIAKHLLKNEGLLFISIGDDEQASLKLLCDEIFECIAVVPRIAKKGSNQGTWFRPTKDYVLVYALKKDNIAGFYNPYTESKDSKQYNYVEEDTGKKYRKAHSLFQGSLDPLRGCKNQRYYIEAPDGTLIIPPGPHLPEDMTDGGQIIPISGDDKVWRWSKESYIKQKHLIMFRKSKRSPLIDSHGNHTDWNVYEKKYEEEEVGKEENVLPDDVIYKFLNSLGTTLLNEMGIKFPFSKPIQLIQYLITITKKNSAIKILDFFAGSGTTLHATMQLNSEDGGHRQCILVTNNENNICEEVTYERNKRVIEGYTKPNGEFVEGLHDNNLRYFKIGYVPREKDLTNIERFARQSVNLLCIKEDVYKEQTMFGELETEGFRYFKDGDKQFLVILEPDMIDPIIEEITKMDYEGKMPVYVFTTGHYPYAEDFWQVSEKVDLYPYPTCVYGACEKVMPKMEDKLLDFPGDIELSDEEANMTCEDLNKE